MNINNYVNKLRDGLIHLLFSDGMIQLLIMAFAVANIKVYAPFWFAIALPFVVCVLNTIWHVYKYGECWYKKLAYGIVGIIIGTL